MSENEAAVEEQKPEEQKTDPGLKDALGEIAGSPDENQIELWKQEHGEVLCSGFSDTEIFIWRTITRAEFIGLQGQLAQAEGATQFDLEEQMVATCVLWGSPVGLASLEKKAGSLSTLHEQIMQNSNFMNPAMASALVIKL